MQYGRAKPSFEAIPNGFAPDGRVVSVLTWKSRILPIGK